MGDDKQPAEQLSADPGPVEEAARESEAAASPSDATGTERRATNETDGPDDPTPESEDVAPTTDAPDEAAAAEESGGDGLV